jgi:hypothetical protein
MDRSLQRIIWALAVTVSSVAAANGQDPSWIGDKVMPKKGCRLRLPDRVIDERQNAVPLVVKQVHGSWLWVGDGEEGWVAASDVVPLADALDYYTDLLQTSPSDAWAYLSRGITWATQGQLDPAIEDFTQAIHWDPTSAIAFNNRGVAWYSKGDYRRASDDLAEAIRLYDRYAWAYNNLAWLLATCIDAEFRDGPRSVELATRACELSRWKNANRCDTLAAAYAESGDMESAVRWQKRALELNPSDASFQQDGQRRLALYVEGRPYRHAPEARAKRPPSQATSGH